MTVKNSKRDMKFIKITNILKEYLDLHGYDMQEKSCYIFAKRKETSDIKIEDIKETLYDLLAKSMDVKKGKIMNLCRITAYDNSCYIHFKKEVE